MNTLKRFSHLLRGLPLIAIALFAMVTAFQIGCAPELGSDLQQHDDALNEDNDADEDDNTLGYGGRGYGSRGYSSGRGYGSHGYTGSGYGKKK